MLINLYFPKSALFSILQLYEHHWHLIFPCNFFVYLPYEFLIVLFVK